MDTLVTIPSKEHVLLLALYRAVHCGVSHAVMDLEKKITEYFALRRAQEGGTS